MANISINGTITLGDWMKSYLEFRKKMIRDASKLHIPVHGEFELTSQCNLSCEMCYVKEYMRKKELSTGEWKKVFKSAVDKGMLFALLTGGEILTRKDFVELYNYLYDLGVKITLYTNGTLITEEICEVLVKRPPDHVSITLYGSSNETYEAITKVKNGFTLVNRGIDLLIKNKINLALRTIPLKKIYQEIDDLINYVKSKNMVMGYTLYVGPRRNSCNEPLDFRLNPNELVDFEQKFLKAFGSKSYREFRKSNDGFSCAALKSAFFITWEGFMQPCALLSNPGKKVTSDSFASVWDELGERAKEVETCKECSTCEYKSECVQCVAKLYLEEGSTAKCSKYLKALAEIRREVRNGKV